MHVIAYVYHWEPATLWLLSKSERKMWFNMIEEQKRQEAKQMKSEDEEDDDYDEEDNEDLDNDDY
jgi:hypothetical protein